MTAIAANRGLLAGVVGVAAMTVAENLNKVSPEDQIHTFLRILWSGFSGSVTSQIVNDSNELGDALEPGHHARAVRGWMAGVGLRGPIGSFLHMNLRLLNDQTLENATGAGVRPWTWPVDEQAIDLMGKGIYAFVTGAVADASIPSPNNSPEPCKP